jgi:cell wall-associated NlpC family hydrolase
MATPQQIQYIAQRARAFGLDPNAVLAIAGHEGLGGGVGDNGTSFGPFQLHIGGAMPSGVSNPQQWAWSPAGINYALSRMGAAKGLTGKAAVTAISTQFERPSNPGAEIADAMAHYGSYGGRDNMVAPPKTGGGAVQPSPISQLAGGSAQRQQLASLLMGATGNINFNSNQIQTPNLLALAQLRQQDVTGTGTVKYVSAPLAAGTVSTPQGGSLGSSIAKTALSQLGQPYQYGGQAKLGNPTDCSGLLQESAAAHGISIPRTTYDQWQTGKSVATNQLQPGDAVFFRGSDARGNLPGHVGIYIGNGKYVEDPHTGGTVSISTLADAKDYVGARRYW